MQKRYRPRPQQVNGKFHVELYLQASRFVVDGSTRLREGIKKNRFFLGKSPKLWVGGGQES